MDESPPSRNGVSRYVVTALVTILIAILGGLVRRSFQHGESISRLEARMDSLAHSIESTRK